MLTYANVACLQVSVHSVNWALQVSAYLLINGILIENILWQEPLYFRVICCWFGRILGQIVHR